ncbi:MAG TPA: hypothetical protein VML55_14320, partial [Planctomycetaceae bacterium]|nr:hypothetical protein [Planctomycetaceae bacterium]
MHEPVCFRHRFNFDPGEWPDCQGFRLTVESKLPTVKVWLNGGPVDAPPGPKREIKLDVGRLRHGKNVLALLVSPEVPADDELDEESRKRIQQVAVNPLAAGLDSRPADEILTKDQLAGLGLFSSLEKMPRVEEFPGSIVLRKFRQGEVACFQGEPGHSAFYVLSAEDVFHLRRSQLKFYTEELANTTRDEIGRMSPADLVELLALRKGQVRDAEARIEQAPQLRKDLRIRQRLDDLRREVAQLGPVVEAARGVLEREGTDAQDALRQAATAWILPGVTRRPQPRTWLGRLTSRLFGGRGMPLDETPLTIKNDGPAEIDYKTRCGSIYEGELFGEMACMTLAPRAATVVADRDGYMLEFLRNVFNLIQRDDGYRQRILELYRKRLLSAHLQHLRFLKHASAEQIRWLGERVEMKIVDAGTVIFNEGEPSDCVYLIKTGLVQVVKGVQGVHVALNEPDVTDWRAFARELLKGDPGLLIPCPNCGNELRLPDRSLLGRRGKCPSCGHKFVLEDPKDREDAVELELADPQKSLPSRPLKGVSSRRPVPP